MLRKSFVLFAKRLRIHELIKFTIAIDDFRFICDQMINLFIFKIEFKTSIL